MLCLISFHLKKKKRKPFKIKVKSVEITVVQSEGGVCTEDCSLPFSATLLPGRSAVWLRLPAATHRCVGIVSHSEGAVLSLGCVPTGSSGWFVLTDPWILTLLKYVHKQRRSSLPRPS